MLMFQMNLAHPRFRPRVSWGTESLLACSTNTTPALCSTLALTAQILNLRAQSVLGLLLMSSKLLHGFSSHHRFRLKTSTYRFDGLIWVQISVCRFSLSFSLFAGPSKEILNRVSCGSWRRYSVPTCTATNCLSIHLHFFNYVTDRPFYRGQNRYSGISKDDTLGSLRYTFT